MTILKDVYCRQASAADRPAVVRFFNTIRKELYLENDADVEAMCDNFFANGGAILGCINGNVEAVVAYFLGDPSDDFADKSIGFIYVAGLNPKYRHTAAFSIGLLHTVKTFFELGLCEVRLHALQTDVRLNAIYSSFMETREEQTNARGLPCYLYCASMDYLLDAVANRPKNPRRFDPTPTGRPLVV